MIGRRKRGRKCKEVRDERQKGDEKQKRWKTKSERGGEDAK